MPSDSVLRLAAKVADTATDGARGGIRGWHGTPHVFDPEPGAPLGRFRLDRMGTGEGAQAYGPGIYIAENPSVARGYRDGLLPPYAVRIGDKSIGELYGEMDAAAARMPIKRAEDQYARLQLLEELDNFGDVYGLRASSSYAEAPAQAREWFDRFVSPRFERPGSLYEVRINKSPEDFLSWDQPIGGQALIDDLERMRHFDRVMSHLSDKNPHGEEFFYGLSGIAGSTESAARHLRDSGIDGIRYLDAGSRDGAQGTVNFVVFDPSTIDILNRYRRGGLAQLKEASHGRS